MRFNRLLLILALLSAITPTAALAHSGHDSPIQTFSQMIGPYDLAITLEYPPAAPGTLYLVVAPLGDFGDATIRIRAVPRGFPLDDAVVAEVTTIAGVRIYYADLPVDRAGDWELDVRIDGVRGAGQARIPFTLTLAPVSAQTLPLAIALGSVMALMVTSLALAGIAKQRGQPIPSAIDRGLGYGIFAGLVVAAVLGVQQYSAQANSAASTAIQPTGRPHINVRLATDPAQPMAGQPFRLSLALSDGSTGLPVDDLIPHHDSLIHLVVIDDAGATFAHIHPSGAAPGRYDIDLSLERAGAYTAYIEVERRDSGTQVIQRRFTIGGDTGTPAQPLAGLGSRQVDDLTVAITSSIEPLRAGRQATLTLSFSQGGAPVTDLEPWLGMAGHLIARSDDGTIFGHIHAAGAMAPAGTSREIIAPPSYGPDIRFVYTFPQPGRYQLWAQVQRQGRIYAIPFILTIDE